MFSVFPKNMFDVFDLMMLNFDKKESVSHLANIRIASGIMILIMYGVISCASWVNDLSIKQSTNQSTKQSIGTSMNV